MTALVRIFVILVITLGTLVSCTDNTAQYYTYGPSKSCYKDGIPKDCKTYIANDKLKISVNQANQEVTYQLIGMRLDDSNIIFKTLPNCKVVDVKNFSCENFSISDGKVVNSKLFGDKILSDSSLMFSASDFLKMGLSVDIIHFVTNNSWIIPLGIFVGFILLSTLS